MPCPTLHHPAPPCPPCPTVCAWCGICTFFFVPPVLPFEKSRVRIPTSVLLSRSFCSVIHLGVWPVCSFVLRLCHLDSLPKWCPWFCFWVGACRP
jgi:hypothetical protein